MSIDNATLQEQLAHLPDSERWATRPEVSDLLVLLNPGEKLLAGVTALVKESGKLAVRSWLVVATTNRLICLLRSGAAVRKFEIPVGIMKAAYTDARLGYHEVHVEATTGKLVISGTSKDAAVALSSALSARLTELSQHAQPAAPAENAQTAATAQTAQSASPDVQEQIRQLVAEVEHSKKRIAAIEEVLRRAAARNQAAKAPDA